MTNDKKFKKKLIKMATKQKDSPSKNIKPEKPKVEEILTPENSSDEIDFTPSFKPGVIAPRSISVEMKSSYIDYSMSVIVSRALPEVKDGLKPSQRRILVAMNDMNLNSTAHYRKCAKIAGDTSGNYHPHGETIVYPTLVKMAQDFSFRYPLIDGQGNFGSIDGDPAAAMRYTEARMARITPELLEDLNKGTVTYIPNYDGTQLEPTVLPALFPNMLANGSQGIAVGMATQIPPHNLVELINALLEMIKRGNKFEGKAIYNELRLKREKLEKIPQTLSSKPESYFENYFNIKNTNYKERVEEIEKRLETDEEVLYPNFKSDITPEELIEIIPAPDFPTGGIIYNRKEILNAYATGRGRILQRAKASIIEGDKGRFHIIITEIPYQVNKAHLVLKIANLVRDKRIEGIADIRDESSKEGMRVVIILKKDAQPKAVLNKLFKYTEMQKVFNANMIALVDQEPLTLPLRKILELFLSFRITVTIRRYEYDLAAARYHAHILEGLLKALDLLDEVISTIRKSKTQETAKQNLIDKFKFTEVQAQAILDMQLRRLAALERKKLEEDYKGTRKKITSYNEILENEDAILTVISEDLKRVKEKYGDERKSRVVKGKVDEISEEDMIAQEETLVTISHSGYIKRISPDIYHTQKRGGKGVTGAKTKEDDFIEHVFLCNTHDELLLFSNKGKVFCVRVFEIPEYGRSAKGIPLVNLVQLDQNELITSILTRDPKGKVSDKKEKDEHKVTKYLIMATKKGVVKKTELDQFAKIRSNGLVAIKLDTTDELTWVKATTGNDEIVLVTHEGRSIRFHEKDTRAQGRNTRGVRGIKFKNDSDFIIGMGIVKSNEDQLLTLSTNGFGKMTKLKGYPIQKRGGSGVYTFRVNTKVGTLVIGRILNDLENEIVVVSEKGKVIRSTLKNIPIQSRQTSGVKVMNINDGDSVSAMAII